MLNVQNITAKLAGLPDQALQQYAAMNKNDPYIMALAVSESNRRKQVRAAQQAQGMQEQPKVVDQAVAEMAQPEDVGIGQLPAGEMEFAGGGILAFAQGDSIPGPKPQYGSGVAFGGSVENWRRMMQGKEPVSPPPAPVEMTDAERKEYERKKELGGMGMALEWLQKKFNVDANNARIIAEGTEKRLGLTPKGAAEARAQFAESDPRRVVPEAPAETADAAADTGASRSMPTAPQMPTGIAQVAGPTAATAAPVSMDYAGAATGMKAAGLFPQATDADFADEKAQKEVVAQEAIDRATAGRTREEDFQKKLGEYGVNKEKRLKEREADLSKDEKSNYGLAFLEAGLAMMGGESPNAFANISKGALQGMGSYKTGLAKLNDRKEKLFDAYDALDDARRSDSKDKFARIEAANDKIDKATLALKQVGADIATKKGDFNRDQTREFTKAVVQTANTEYTTKSQAAEGAANRATQVSVAESRQASERAIAQFSAASNRAIAEGQQATQRFIAELPGDMQKLYTTLGKGDPVAGLKLAKEVEATGKKDIMTLYTEWLKANPTLAMDPNKAMAAFFKQYSVMAGKIPQASDKPTGQARD